MCEKCLCAVAAFLTDQYMIICHSDIPRVEYAHFTRRPPIMEAAKRLDKLSTWEPKVDLLYIWLIYFMSQYLPALPYVLYKFLTKLAWCHSDFSNEVIYFKWPLGWLHVSLFLCHVIHTYIYETMFQVLAKGFAITWRMFFSVLSACVVCRWHSWTSQAQRADAWNGISPPTSTRIWWDRPCYYTPHNKVGEERGLYWYHHACLSVCPWPQGLYNQNMTVSTLSSELMPLLQAFLVWW